tara:strand:+ start:1031 stop:1267 length:237 start_codon:yes stop_codon:yes gene_type:complete
MPKYYVSSGDINIVIEGDGEADAVLLALNSCIEKHGQDLKLEPYFYVSQKGFESGDTIALTSSDILSGLGFDFEDDDA